VLLGAVAYDPKVVTIWDGFRTWLRGPAGLDFDYVLYSNYERQVEDLVGGRIDVAWNSPLAWVRARRLAAARGVPLTPVTMRDTDCDLRSVIVVRADSPVGSLADLAGRTIATGAVDSPQATLLPLSLLRSAGLAPGRDVTVRRFDIGVGLHGDHIGGERDAARALFAADPGGRPDAAAMIDSNLLLFGREGVLPAGAVRVLAQTPPYDHCTMTAGPSVADGDKDLSRFADLLLGMDYADAALRPLLDLEGLKEWRVPRLSGYDQLERAVDEAGFYDAAGAVTAADYRP
jgi:phosphonate transport system substrate-binding protein